MKHSYGHPSELDSPRHQNEQTAGPASTHGNVCVSVIDVGKGDCILLEVDGRAALIDAGYDKTSGKVLAHLRGRGVSQLEFLIITHYDRDHIGGTRAIGEELGVNVVYLPAYEGADKHYTALMAAIDNLGLRTQSVAEALSLTLGGASLAIFPSGVEFVPNAKGNEGNDNDLSLVTTLTYGADSYLFTGDLEEDGLQVYLRGDHGRFDVLKVPHHGEKSPLTDELVDDVQPRIAVITDSADDPADKKVLKLLQAGGAEVYRTGSDGTVIVESDGKGSYAVRSA